MMFLLPAAPTGGVHSKWRSRLVAFFALALLLPIVATGPISGQSANTASDLSPVELALAEKHALAADQTQLTDGELSALANDLNAAPPGATINVEVHGNDLNAVRVAIDRVDGVIHGEVPGFFIEARVLVTALDLLGEEPAVRRLSPVTEVIEAGGAPLANNPDLASIVEAELSFEAWHAAGHRGAGQKIGILDVFGQNELILAISNNRIPSPSGSFCRINGRSCSIATPNGGAHGVAVAEITHLVAPEAELYFATVRTTADLAAAIEWFGAQGVSVINRSETSEFDGPGDGTGPTASLIDRAVALGMVWVAAAGNAGGDAVQPGQNWIGEFNDPDGNGFHNFESGTERMAFTCGFLLGMRWDDWDPAVIPTDYDIWIYDTLTATSTEFRGNDVQNTVDHIPLEHVNTNCSSTNDIDYISIHRFEDRRPDGVDQIQILGNQTLLEEWVNESSATGPGNTSANPGAVIVGAADSPTNTTLASYSSQGPTLDGRAGIDIVAPSCLPIPAFFSFCFSGTSASAPVVTGTVAILRGAGVFNRAVDVNAQLTKIAIDQDVRGRDPKYGVGVLRMPSPLALGVPSGPECSPSLASVIGPSGQDELRNGGGNRVFTELIERLNDRPASGGTDNCG